MTSRSLLFELIVAKTSLLKPVLWLHFIITDKINICPFHWIVDFIFVGTINGLWSYGDSLNKWMHAFLPFYFLKFEEQHDLSWIRKLVSLFFKNQRILYVKYVFHILGKNCHWKYYAQCYSAFQILILTQCNPFRSAFLKI